MKSILVVLAAVALLASSAGLAEAKSERAAPSLRMKQLSPLVLVGERFRPAERVVLRVTVGARTLVRARRASPGGTFTVAFPAVTVDRCGGGFSAVATAASGAVAKIRLPQALCPPALP
jgi:hypothetical protein